MEMKGYMMCKMPFMITVEGNLSMGSPLGESRHIGISFIPPSTFSPRSSKISLFLVTMPSFSTSAEATLLYLFLEETMQRGQ